MDDRWLETDAGLERVLDALTEELEGEPVPEAWKRRVLSVTASELRRTPMSWPAAVGVSAAVAAAALVMHAALLTITSTVAVVLLAIGYGSTLRLLMQRA